MEGAVRCNAGNCALVSESTDAARMTVGTRPNVRLLGTALTREMGRNASYIFGVLSAATAIATGNTAILKASKLTPRCYWAVGKAFHEGGLPDGVLDVLSCSVSRAAEVVGSIIKHHAVRKVNFPGSAAVGRQVARTCGENLKPCFDGARREE